MLVCSSFCSGSVATFGSREIGDGRVLPSIATGLGTRSKLLEEMHLQSSLAANSAMTVWYYIHAYMEATAIDE